MLLSQQYIDNNGNIIRLVSEAEIRSDKPLIVSYNLNKFIKLINKNSFTLNNDDKKFVNEYWIEAYDELLEILRKEYKIFASTFQKLENKKNDYIKLDENNKHAVIDGLINLMKTSQGNLKAIGLNDREGRMSGKTFSEKNLLQMTFIDKSITGIYERRYKIDGMEDNTSK